MDALRQSLDRVSTGKKKAAKAEFEKPVKAVAARRRRSGLPADGPFDRLAGRVSTVPSPISVRSLIRVCLRAASPTPSTPISRQFIGTRIALLYQCSARRAFSHAGQRSGCHVSTSTSYSSNAVVASRDGHQTIGSATTFAPQRRERTLRSGYRRRRRSRRFTPLQVAVLFLACLLTLSAAVLGLLLWLRPY